MASSAGPMDGTEYLPGERVQYYSVSQKEWYKATISRKDPTKHQYVVKLDGSNNMKSATWKKLRPLFEKNDVVEYYSATKLAWYPAKIVSSTYAKDGTIEISVDNIVKHAQNDQLRRRREPASSPSDQNNESKQLYQDKREKYSQMDHQDMEDRDKKEMYNRMNLEDMDSNGAVAPAVAPPVLVSKTANKGNRTRSASGTGPDSSDVTPYDNNYNSFDSSAFGTNPQPEMTRVVSSEKMRSVKDTPVLRKSRSASSELETDELVARVYCLRLTPKKDLLKSINTWAAKHNVAAGFVQACVGSTATTVLRPAGSSTTRKFEGKFEIVSLSGTVSTNGSHLHLSISDSNCVTYGGHLVEGTKVRTTCELVLGKIDGAAFHRRQDPRSGYKELFITS